MKIDKTANKLLFTLLLTFFASIPSMFADDGQATQWKNYGTCALNDGWVTGGLLSNLVIEQDVDNPFRFRIVEPYKSLKEGENGNTSEYPGEIIFNISNRDYVHIEYNVPAGYNKDGEICITNDYGFFYNLLKDDTNIPAILDRNNAPKTTYNKGIITVENSKYMIHNKNQNLVETGRKSQIIMPRKAGDWTFNCDGDYLDFTFAGSAVDGNYDAASKTYKIKDIKDSKALKATIKSQYASYLIESVSVTPDAPGVKIDERSKSFTFSYDDFPGEFTFDVKVAKVETNWTINADKDYFDFKIGDKALDTSYDSNTSSYALNNIGTSGTLHAEFTSEYTDGDYRYKITSVTYDRVKKQLLFTDIPTTELPEPQPVIAEDGKSFDINVADFIGTYNFTVTTEYDGALITDIAKPIVSVTQNTAYIRLSYNSALVPEGSTIKAFFGPANKDVETYEDFVVGLASGASVNILNLKPGTNYTYNVVLKVYNEDDEVISTNRPVSVTFTTNQTPTQADGVDAATYQWDNSAWPDNRYAVCTFTSYILGASSAFPEISPTVTSIEGKYFNKTHEDGKRELTLLFAHFLPNPSYQTDDQFMYQVDKWFIIKNPSHDSGETETLYVPTSPADWSDPDGINPYGLVTESGVRYNGFKKIEMGLADKSKAPSISDYRWDIDLINYFRLPTSNTVYNVILVLGFDEKDEKYETPTYMTIRFEEEPLTALIGTIAQTSPEFDPEKDNVGGWHTWVPLVPTGDSENPYPYVYDFVAQEETYDLSFTADNSRLFDILGTESGNGIVNPGFYLQEIYPHSMFWNSDFESPSNWNSKTRGRDIRAQQTNYYPGFVGPYIDGRKGHINGREDEELVDYTPNKNESIRLTDLVPGHHYQLVIDHPSYGWETDPDNPTFTYICNHLEYITLVDYDIHDGTAQAYQLVEDTQNPGTYYTYDFKNAGKKDDIKIYEVSLADDDTVISYEETKKIDQAVAYQDKRYNFTDKIFVFVNGYEYEEVDENDVIVKVLGAKADVVFKAEEAEDDIRHTVDAKEGSMKVASVFSMKGVNKPLDEKTFNIEKYTLDYQRGYYTCKDNTLELFVTDRPVTHRLVPEYNNKTEKNPRLYDPETAHLKDTQTTGTLVVPTPKRLNEEAEYSFAADRFAQDYTPENSSVKIQFYAQDLKNTEYEVMDYTLPEQKLHIHDYHITFPYESSNVTKPLGDIMEDEVEIKNGEDGEEDIEVTAYTGPNIRFHFVVGDDIAVDIHPNNYTTPGFFNADLGDIYDVDINQNLTPTRDINLVYTPREFPSTQIYSRWAGAMTAQVTLGLNAPELINFISQQEKTDDNKFIVRSINREVEDLGGGQSVEVIKLHGLNIFNTDDEINDSGNSTLMTGDAKDDETTLYLLDLYDLTQGLTAKVVKSRVLLTKDELRSYKFPILVSEPFNTGSSYDPIVVKDHAGEEVYPFGLRNVYLFPVANLGFNNESDVTLPETSTDEGTDTDTDADTPSNAPRMRVAQEGVTYYGVTTPVLEPIVTFDEETPTGVSDIVVSTSALARAGRGTIEVLAEDAVLIRADGTTIGIGQGVYEVTPGVYVAVKEAAVQKLIVR